MFTIERNLLWGDHWPTFVHPFRDHGDACSSLLCLPHMVPISILWYRESRTIQLKCTFAIKQERITVSNPPTHHHGHTNFWCVCLLECSYYIIYGPEPRASGRNTSSNRHASQTVYLSDIHENKISYREIPVESLSLEPHYSTEPLLVTSMSIMRHSELPYWTWPP